MEKSCTTQKYKSMTMTAIVRRAITTKPVRRRVARAGQKSYCGRRWVGGDKWFAGLAAKTVICPIPSHGTCVRNDHHRSGSTRACSLVSHPSMRVHSRRQTSPISIIGTRYRNTGVSSVSPIDKKKARISFF
jgi:hypothetical protein